MDLAQYPQIGAELIASGYGRRDAVAIVENGTTERQRVIRTVSAICRGADRARVRAAGASVHRRNDAFRRTLQLVRAEQARVSTTSRRTTRARVSYWRTARWGAPRMIYESILDTIGDTPVVKLHRIPPKHVTIYVKIEAFNPLAR